jgi:hypothetical protein
VRRAAALLAPLLGLVTGCGEILEVQHDPIRDVRPSTLVDRLQQDVATFKATWEPQRKGGYGPVDYEIGEIAKAADAMEADLRTKGGRFTAELEKAYSAGSVIVQQLAGRTSRPVQESWQPLRRTLNTMVTEYRNADPAAIYSREATPKRTVSPIKSPADDYDSSFRIDQVQAWFGSAWKSWEGAAARRAGAPWAKALEGELTGFSTGLGELTRVKSGRRTEVVPIATRLADRAGRVSTLVRAHQGELPRQLVEEWSQTAGWLRMLTE